MDTQGDQDDRDAKLQALALRVAQLERLNTDLIRIVCHDMRNPVGIITGYMELLSNRLENHDDPKVMQYVDAARSGAKRIDKIVSDILSLSRIENVVIPNPFRSPFDLCALVQKFYDEYESTAQAKEQQFTLETTPPALTIKGDSAQLGEAIRHLIDNAIKFTPNNGKIRVSLRLEPDLIVFEVEDNGYGIPEDRQSHLFQPFYRPRMAETADIEGNGMGLYIVKAIVGWHGGKVRFKSVYQQGSTFGFELPRSLMESEGA